ncbi:unnamed protein product [Zymoseptoria tritici ST99CH_1A5]|uniref:BIR-domain-containing protein n=1 Tax=Zymoseptoria tritici ST99CH_1A5 TaxID=1276529 RepID=A0A1Y6L771_ZYMTR|nr:unnamed protein product [Zymoseptoria tritici ST99CH_3D1]SMY19178.1 unnamed protein product [Zymoseptoria tritici ST99CH_1A5]
MTAPAKDLNEFAARLATFTTSHHLAKRRASSNASKKKKDGTVEWPHEFPSGHALARAGFFYRPSHDSNDNVQCFMCSVKLDGWEATDDPVSEHLAHSSGCAWATSISVMREEGDLRKPEQRDPLSEELYAARTATFKSGDGWPHEGKKGWKCKISKMVEAGWVLDPTDETEDRDGVTCMYCNLSLDGWEPKDDPFVEHKRREPACPYFGLLEVYHGAEAANGKIKKTKGRGKASARSSIASKASRVSTQSIRGEVPSVAGSLGDMELDGDAAGVDDSIVTTATTASQVSTTTGKKKGGRTKAAAKGTKGKKKVDEEDRMEIEYPDIAASQQVEAQTDAPPAKTTRKGGRESKQLDSSVVEVSQMDIAPPKKATRTRKAKVTQPEPEPEPEPQPEPEHVPATPDVDAIEATRKSEVAAQLQEELDHSMEEPELIQRHIAKPQRGVKRNSEGVAKVDSSMFDEQPNDKPVVKGKRSRKPTKVSTASSDMDLESQLPHADSAQADRSTEAPQHEENEEVVKPKAKAASRKTKPKPKGKKASTARSSRSSKLSNQASELELDFEEHEDLERDELEIEKELERIAAEELAQAAVQTEQDQVDEFETSPSQGRISKDTAELEAHTEDEHEVPTEKHDSPPRISLQLGEHKSLMFSPTGSDKENLPSSVMAPSAKQTHPQLIMSPTKTSRIPLALGTPNRSPAKQFQSPSKQISHLTSNPPWQAVDLDTVLLASPQPTPGRVGRQLVAAAGELTSPEKKMSVEEWVRFRAEQGEETLRRRCEQMVAAFEREGMRGLECLSGIQVVD